LNLKKPLFFIGGLAQMGGLELAAGVLQKIKSNSSLWGKAGWSFAGTLSKKYPADPKNHAGWGSFIDTNAMQLIQTISLPTVWSFHESDETQYVF